MSAPTENAIDDVTLAAEDLGLAGLEEQPDVGSCGIAWTANTIDSIATSAGVVKVARCAPIRSTKSSSPAWATAPRSSARLG